MYKWVSNNKDVTCNEVYAIQLPLKTFMLVVL